MPAHEEFVSRSKNVRYLPGVDHLRGLAVLIIVVYHGMQQIRVQVSGGDVFPKVHDPLSALVVEGHTGVTLFMVLSGFILTFGADRAALSYRPYLRNRVLRVAPMYLLVLAIGIMSVPAAFTLSGFVPYLTLLATPPLAFATFGPWSAVLWSVSVEFAFYLLFPFLLAMLQRDGVRALVRVLVLMNALRLLAAVTNPHTIGQLSYWTIVGRLDQFVLGMLAAWCFQRGYVRLGRRSGLTLAATGVLLVGCALWWFNAHGGFFGSHRWRAVWPPVEGVLWAAVVLGYVSATAGVAGRLARWPALPGIVSYSAFLLHYPVVIAVADRHWHLVDAAVPNAALLTVLVVFPSVAALATLGYVTVERPFMQRRVRYLEGPTTA
jgi:peptidoglycan/LPS O-acetylase OafA/YrhL